MLDLINILSWILIICGVVVALCLLFKFKAAYGRYADNAMFTVPPQIAWCLQEAPAFFIPFYYTFYSKTDFGFVINLMMIYHYFNRTFIFPFRLKTKNGTPVLTFLSAVAFCCWNGYIQGAYNSQYQPMFDEMTYFGYIRFFVGCSLFIAGHLVNINADNILMNLRKPGETGYKIPQGGMFEYVSCANYFGEIVEWFGYAIAANSLPAFAFAIFTLSNIGPRALTHHSWYLEKFANYPKERKALIPFLL